MRVKETSHTIRSVELSDAAAIADLYNHYVANTMVTFECACVDQQEIAARIESITGEGFPWICYVDQQSGELLGYAYAGKWRKRLAYRFVAESAIYLRSDSTGKGIGGQLYRELFARLRQQGIRRVVAGISVPNPASVAAHQSMGFRKVALFEQVGFKFDRWIDVQFWQADL